MGLQILIVDDSATMRTILRKAVVLSGYEVSAYLEASDGAEALRVLAASWIDLILLDVHMPVMDGLTLLKLLQQDAVYRKIPVVLVTTEACQEAIEEAFHLGVRAHVKKPFQPESIRGVLKEILGGEYAREAQEDLGGCDF
ncbi:MAG: response regulator [bacterium]